MTHLDEDFSHEEMKLLRAFLRVLKNTDNEGGKHIPDDDDEIEERNSLAVRNLSPTSTTYPPRNTTTGKEKELSPEDTKLLRNFLRVLKSMNFEDTDEEGDISRSYDESGKDKPVLSQSVEAPNGEAAAPGTPVNPVETEKNEPDTEDIYHQIYKQFKDVHDKLPLLENAISRLGGTQDVIYSIRLFQAILVLALRWDQYGLSESNTRSVFFKNGFLNPTEVLARSWLDLEEDGTMFKGPRSSDVKFQADIISESIGAMFEAFDELGTVNGCQFVSLCSTLSVIWYKTQNKIRWQIKSYGNAEGKEKEQAMKDQFGELLSKDIHMLSEEITKTIERDVPNLRTAEQRLTNEYTSMTTTATFFSSITVTAIQISSTMTGTALKNAVNTVWFTSLVLSIGSVIVSLIGLSWLQSHIPMWATKERTLKRGVIFLLRNGPVMLMTAAAAMFMLGLALFVNSSNQARSTSIITSSIIALVSVTLIFLAVYFAVLYQGDEATKVWSRLVRTIQKRMAVRLWDNLDEGSI